MKARFLFISLVCCFVLQTNAQTANSNTIVNEGSSWAILSYRIFVFCPDCPVWTEYIYFDGDSIIGEYSYKKVFSCRDKLCENIKFEGLMREQDKKTYFIYADYETECLLYDFSLEEGMIFEYRADLWWQFREEFYVKQVDSIEINGVQRKQITFTQAPPYDDYVIATWIEGIGSLAGLFYPCGGYFLTGSTKLLLCHFQNNELIYKDSSYSMCHYDNPEDLMNDLSVSMYAISVDNYRIFPNPVDDILNISCLNNVISRIEILDISGKNVYSQIYKETVDVSSLSNGLYFLKVYGANEQVTVFKIIKK